MNSKNKNFEDSFDKFIASSDLKEILSAFNQLCDLVDLNPSENSSTFYSKLQYKLKGYWKAQTLFANLDKKVLQKEYRNRTSCSNIKALVIGSGPCGLRCAIELALLGARAVVIDKRESFSRNNVLHLWPFVINDLKALGAKIFFGMFCAGSIDHISIRRLQCILFKVALLFGVQFFVGVTFESLILPVKNSSVNVTAKGDINSASFISQNFGWRAKVMPSDHIISNYEFNTIVGADGKTNILGFPRKELRCRLAIAITANFVNKNTFEEAQAEEISGVAFIFNQQFFKDIYNKTGIDLENIVYYKDETHYFVMTAKKCSLLSKGVIKQDFEDPELLLHYNNINYDALQSYAKEAANVVTEYKIPNLEFSKNHRDEPDVAVFDFTHMFAAENASKIIEINGYFLLQMLVGDSLLEPFWPTGSGCALGFLSSLDAAWLVRRIGMINNAFEQNKISNYQQKILILEAIAERESVYQRLSQTTSSNMPPNFNTYTLNPRTRYVQCKTSFIEISQILHLYDTDDKSKNLISYKNITKCDLKNKQNQVFTPNSTKLMGLNLSLNNSLKDSSVNANYIDNTSMKGEYMLRWFQIRLDRYFNFKLFKVDDLHKSWVSGVAFLCLIHLYSPNSIDLSFINDEDRTKNLETAFKLFEEEFHISYTYDTNSIENLDSEEIFIYLEKIYEKLRVLNPNRLSEEIYEHSSVDIRKAKRHWIPRNSNDIKYKCPGYQMNTSIKLMRKSSGNRFGCDDIEKGIIEMRKEEILRLYTSNFKEPQKIIKKSNNGPLDKVDKVFQNNSNNKHRDLKIKGNDKYSVKLFEKYKMVGQLCHFCKTRIFQQKHDTFDNYVFHKHCLRCQYCNKDLNNQQFKLLKDNHVSEGKFLCVRHFEKLSTINLIREKNVSNTLRDLVLKEDKKFQKMTSKEYLQADSKCASNNRSKIKKPKYGLNDYGSFISLHEESVLPVFNICEKINNLHETDIDIYLKKNLLSLRRVNDESDEEYDGSLDESTSRVFSLDVVEPQEENQYSWSLCFTKEDLEYSLKKCQVIRKNRLIYKKYKSKEESTSDESEINMLVHDICRTSDEDILDDVAVPDEIQNLEKPRSTGTFQIDNLLEPQIFNDVSNGFYLLENNSNDKTLNTDITKLNDQEEAEQKCEMNMIDNNISEINKFDNSRNLRQMAKLKFCTEPPKPVSINPKEFISQINHNKLTLLNTPYYLEVAEYLPSVNDVFVTVTSDYSALRAQILVHEKFILSASILSIHCHDCDFKIIPDSIDEVNPPHKYNNSLTTDYFEDQSVLISKNKYIDSLSVNTEDSSVTHTEIISENEFLKNNVPLKCRLYHKATVDSELDISMGKLSVDEPFESNFCSNNSLNSIPTSSFNSSANSDISASSESDGKKYNKISLFNNRTVNSVDVCQKNKYKILPNFLNKSFKKSKSSRFIKGDNIKKRLSDNIKSSKYVSASSEANLKDMSIQDRLFFNTVTPPQDIELDDYQIKCLEINSQFSFAVEGSLPLKNIESISTKCQRINNLHQQLENIEDRLNELGFKDNDIIKKQESSQEISQSNVVIHEDSKLFNSEKIEVDERIAMGLIL